jgi:hypothetical protein
MANDTTPPASPTGGHRRRASVPLSPFWTDPEIEKSGSDNEMVSSPRVSQRGLVELPMAEIAFFPLPMDDAASDEKALLPEKRPSRRASTHHHKDKKGFPAEVGGAPPIPFPLTPRSTPAPEFVVEGKEKVDKAEKEGGTSVSSDTTVRSSDSVQSEFSENTAGSKFFGFLLFFVRFVSAHVTKRLL